MHKPPKILVIIYELKRSFVIPWYCFSESSFLELRYQSSAKNGVFKFLFLHAQFTDEIVRHVYGLFQGTGGMVSLKKSSKETKTRVNICI